jgi:hypothetical protein
LPGAGERKEAPRSVAKGRATDERSDASNFRIQRFLNFFLSCPSTVHLIAAPVLNLKFEFPSKPDFSIMPSSVFRLAPLPSPPVPLPPVPGPKLAPFTPNAQADIEFFEFLGQANNADSQVWKVKINGAGLFALKAVRDDARHTG